MRYFDRFRVDPDDEIVWRDDARVPITPKAFALLRCLLDRAGEIVTKDDILREVWPDAHVDPANIKVLVREIRIALQDDVERPRLVRTIAGRGYSFVAPVLDIPDAQADASAPFVGRLEELGVLEQAFDAAITGDRRTVFVFGDHGIGKTALCESFIRRAGARGSLRVMRCHSREQPETEPGGALAAALGRSFRTRRDIVAAIEERAAHTPLVLLLEDAHWAASATMEALVALGLGHEPARLLVVVTSRPLQLLAPTQYIRRAHLELLTHGRGQEITIPPLDVRHVGRYLESRCGPHPLGDTITTTLHRVTEGNPLFLVTAIDSLIRKDRLVEDGNGWRLTLDPEGLEAEIPRSMTAIIMRQLDELDGDERQAIEAGAVAGMEFTLWSAARAADADDAELEPVLEQIVRRRTLIVRHGGGAAAGESSPHYTFKHSAYRDCVLQRIGPMTRRRMHARLGLALDASAPEDDLRSAAELARHFEAAHDHARSAHHLGRAARHALHRLAVRDAIAMLKRAVEHASCAPGSLEDPTAVRLRVELGKAQLAAGDTDDALVTFKRLQDPSITVSYFDDHVAALAGLMEARAYTSREEALFLATRIRELASAPRSGVPRSINARAAAVEMCLDGWSRSLSSLCLKAGAMARNGNSPEAASVAISLMAADCFESRYKRVIATGAAVMPTLLDTGALSECMFGYYAMAYALVQLARWTDARRTIESATVLAQRSGSPLHAATIRLFGVWVDLEMGRFEQAYHDSITDRAFLQANDWSAATGLSLLLRARAALSLGLVDEALGELDTIQAREKDSRVTLDWLTRIPFHLVSAAAALAQGDPLNAHTHAESASRAAALTGEKAWRSLAATMGAEVALARGEPIDAGERLRAARAEIAKVTAPIAAARIEAIDALLHSHVPQPA